MVNSGIQFGGKVKLNEEGKDGLIDITGLSCIKRKNDKKSLSNLSTILNVPVPILHSYSSWYKIDDDYYYYKDRGLFNELFSSILLSEFDLRSPEYLVVENNGKLGIASKNFRNRKMNYDSFDTLFLHKCGVYPESFDEYKRFLKFSYKGKDVTKAINSSLRLVAYDFFTGNTDRCGANVLFEHNESVDLSTIFDNEFLFTDKNPYHYDGCLENLLFPKYESRILGEEMYTLLLIKRNIELSLCLSKCLDININEIINRVVKKYNLIIMKKEREFLIDYFDRKKSIIELTIRKGKEI